MSARAAALRGEALERRLAIAEIAAAEPGEVDLDDLRALVECLGFGQKSVQRPAAEACAALHGAGAPVRALLLEALAGADPRRRWGAAYALGRAEEDPREALPVALDGLGSDDGDVRWAAAEIVQRLARRHPEIADELLHAAAGEPAARRKMAFYCLRDLGAATPGTLAAALRALADADEGVVLAALSALSKLAPGEAAAASAIVALLSSANPRLRRAAAQALSRIGSDRSEVDEALARAAGGDDESLARVARGALERRRRSGGPP